MTRETHVSDDDLARYIDDDLDADARVRLEAHLAECDDCRHVLVQATRAIPQGASRADRGRSLGRWTAIATLAAAAAILIVVVPRVRRNEVSDRDPRTRDGAGLAGDNTPRIMADSPAPDALVRLDTLVFRWKSLSPGASYELTISDVAGGLLWSTQTTGTSAALPDSVARRMLSGSTYYWRVDAVLQDLRSTTSDPRAFVPAPR